MRGAATGALLLIAGWVLVQEPVADRLGPLARIPANIARRIIDPTVPAIGAATAARAGKPRKGGAPIDAAAPAGGWLSSSRPSQPSSPDFGWDARALLDRLPVI